MADAYELLHRASANRARLQKAQEVWRANMSGRLVTCKRSRHSNPARQLPVL